MRGCVGGEGYKEIALGEKGSGRLRCGRELE